MKPALFAVTSLLLAAAPLARAQSREDPSLIFTIYAGLSSGGQLWNLPAQGLLAPGGPPPPQDTVGLARWLRPGLVAGLSGSYFRSVHFGWTADIAYLGFVSEERCAGPAAYQPDSENLNQQVCTSAQGQHVATSIVGLLAGATYRFMPAATVQPYVRATGGLGLLGNSFIQTSGIVLHSSCPTASRICAVTILDEKKESQFTWIVSLAAGTTFWLSPGYRFRFEARDVIASLPVVNGPRDPLDNSSTPPTGRMIKHVPTLMVGLDVLLERRHTRRY